VAVSAPLLDPDMSGTATVLASALGIGAAFGWTLERAGLGNARKLAGQFYGTDFTVVKVMFSAIVTAMLGVFWLAWFGVLDLSRLYVPETFVAPQIAGGAIFGIGFVASGLCPGTSCVAAATGRVDGALTAFGMFCGVVITGLAFPWLSGFYASTAWGVVTIPDLLHVSPGVAVALVVALALCAFVVSGRFVPDDRGRSTRRGLALAAVVLGASAAALGPRAAASQLSSDVRGTGGTTVREAGTINPIDLASDIMDGKTGLAVVDLRPAADFDVYHIPTAQSLTLDSLGSPEWPQADRVGQMVLYSADGQQDEDARRAARAHGYGGVVLLRGGMTGWVNDVLRPTLARNASPAQAAAFERRAAISRYFGGTPRRTEADSTSGVTLTADGAAALLRRRGC
jgi:rhodanese-related sulfurtransferase/uncharacterized membrane protein YedE/YeeE